ncbi:hypothetical protein [Aquibacillus sediminis]|uniref:hypothetical protein n=1 Tax=Aquibacillus sediminis TaxID=2574734 RepID=UPI001108DDF4|nr:hypothetical protein [Aquibacillus sediminis]
MLGLTGLLLFLATGFFVLKSSKKKVIESVAFSKFLNDKSKVHEGELNPDQLPPKESFTDKVNDIFANGKGNYSGHDDDDSE